MLTALVSDRFLSPRTQRAQFFFSLNFSKSYENIQLDDAEILNLKASCDYLSGRAF